MTAKERRENIAITLNSSDQPISASTLALQFNVSRQIIVGDIALLRAEGLEISATPRGYIYSQTKTPSFEYEGIIACKHSDEQLLEELYTIVDFGGTVIDVTIEHGLYGQLSGPLNVASRYDADLFAKKMQSFNNKPLSELTDGIHLHRIGCKNEEALHLIQEELHKKNILLED